MSPTHCPLCFEALEVRDVGPCMECGSIAREIEEAQQGKHTYAEYRIFGDLSLVLCNFCWDLKHISAKLKAFRFFEVASPQNRLLAQSPHQKRLDNLGS